MSQKKKKETPIFRPISWLPKIAEVIDGMAEDTKEQIKNFEEGVKKPHVLDDKLMDRAIRLMKEKIEFCSLDEEQLTRWSQLELTPNQRQEVERLVKVNHNTCAESERAIKLCEQIKEGTIDRILEKDDFELALEVLTGKRKLPF